MSRYESNWSTTLWKTAQSAPMLSVEDEQRLAREAQAGSQAAFDELLRAHLRLVLSLARRVPCYGASLQDLVSEGSLGLVEAARRFDPDRGVRLAAYATWWIRAYMRRYTILNRRVVRAPSSRQGRKLLSNLRKTQRELAQLTGVAPDAYAVAEELGVGVRDVEEMEAALSGRDISYHPDPESGSWEIAADGHTPEQLVADAEELSVARGVIADVMASLNERDRKIVEQRYFGDEMSSLATMGEELGLSRERVRQLNRRACDRIRDAVLPFVA